MEFRMLYPLLLLTTTHIIPTSAVVDCRTACGHCDERNDPPELLEVYCSMCEECMERREEWLRNDGDSRRGRTEVSFNPEDNRRARTDIGFDTHIRKQYPFMPANCIPPIDHCREPLSYHSTRGSDEIEERSFTTTTASTTTATRPTLRPSVPDNNNNHNNHNNNNNNNNNNCCCNSIPCIPMLPMCPGMCPQLMLSTLSTNREKRLTASNPSMESLYFYLGVPKKMLHNFEMN